MPSSCSKIFLSLLLALSAINPLYAQSSLAATLKQDDGLQDAVIIAVRNALGARQQTIVVRRITFFVEIGMYIDTYRGTRSASTLKNIQKRYLAAKAELLEPRLPPTIEELVSILEML